MYDVTFWDSARLKEFWGIVESLLKFASPSVLIAVAIIAVGMVMTLVIYAFKKGANQDNRDDDFDIKYYD